MGASYSSLSPLTRCEPAKHVTTTTPQLPSSPDTTALAVTEPPPKLRPPESFEDKVWRKFSQQPLVPLGCLTTAYFLVSGLKAFRNRDPVRSQKMMRGRITAQFVTLLCFAGYVGWEELDLRIMPMYQDAQKVKAALYENQTDASGQPAPPETPANEKE